MTWAKYGTEFFDQLVDADFRADLDDAAMLTHTQALHYLYSVESMSMTFKKSVLRRFATSPKAGEAAEELVRKGLWADHESAYEVLHHEDVFRQSLGYQMRERDRSKKAKRKQREKDSSEPTANEVTHEGTHDVTRDGMRPQTDRQSFNQSDDLSQLTNQNQSVDLETGEVFSDEEVERAGVSGDVDVDINFASSAQCSDCDASLTPFLAKNYGRCFKCADLGSELFGRDSKEETV